MDQLPALLDYSGLALSVLMLLFASLHGAQLVLRVLILLSRYLRSNVADIKDLVVQLWSGERIRVDTADAASVGRFITTLKNTKAPPRRVRPYYYRRHWRISKRRRDE